MGELKRSMSDEKQNSLIFQGQFFGVGCVCGGRGGVWVVVGVGWVVLVPNVYVNEH